MSGKHFVFIVSALFLPNVTQAETGNNDNCKTIVSDGLREYSIKTDSRAYLNSVYDKYCENTGAVKSSSLGLGLDIVVKAIPITFSGSYATSEEAVKNFCRNYSATASGRSDTTSYQEKIVQRAYDSFDQCISLAKTGVIVRHAVRNLGSLDFYIAPGFGRPVTIKGIKTSNNIECRGQDPNASKPVDMKFTLSSRITLRDNKTLNLVCDRKSKAGPNGENIFNEGVVTLLTDIVPNGNYSAFVPRDVTLAENRASEIERIIATLQSENEQLRKKISTEADSRQNTDKVLGRWILNVYGQAKRIGMPPHEGANGWWQKSLIDAQDTAARELPK